MTAQPQSLEHPLLPLETWRSIMSYHPLPFWGLRWSQLRLSKCSEIVPEYAWQSSDAAGREELRRAILRAEQILTEYLGYAPAPHYRVETLTWPRYPQSGIWRYGTADSDGRRMDVMLSEGYIQAVGVEQHTAIAVNVAVTYSDSDGDGVNDRFSLSTPTTVTDPTQIALYISSTDRLNGEGVGPRWRIEPIKVGISGGTVTITGARWMLAKPVLTSGLMWDKEGLDFTDAANFVTTLDIYQRNTNGNGTTSDTSQAAITWETSPYPGLLGCCSSCAAVPDNSTDPAASASIVARVGIRDATLGLVIPAGATYNSDTGIWCSRGGWRCRPPDRVTVRYVAGYPLSNGEMDRDLAIVVARLAAAELARPICACDSDQTAVRELYRWQFDLARTGGSGGEEYGAISAADLDNPLGTRRGHVQAWQYIQRKQLARAINF